MLEFINIIFIPEHILKIPQLIFRNMHLESLSYAANLQGIAKMEICRSSKII